MRGNWKWHNWGDRCSHDVGPTWTYRFYEKKSTGSEITRSIYRGHANITCLVFLVKQGKWAKTFIEAIKQTICPVRINLYSRDTQRDAYDKRNHLLLY
jgi:hypothetical protein